MSMAEGDIPHDDTVSELTQRIAELEDKLAAAEKELHAVPKFVLEQIDVKRGHVVLMRYKEKVSLEEARKDYVAMRSWFQRENLHVRLLQLSQNLDLACVDEALMNTFGWFKKGGKL